jgi:hypothetical protein
VAMPDYHHSEACGVCLVDSCLVMEARADHLIHTVVTSLRLYFPRLVLGVSVEVYSCLASQQASSHPDVVWEAVVVARRGYHQDLAPDVPQVAATVVVGPCSRAEALWQTLAVDGRGSRPCLPCPRC